MNVKNPAGELPDLLSVKPTDMNSLFEGSLPVEISAMNLP